MTPEFGRCNDSNCNENSIRLFLCSHHCSKLVCLNHLIEHDQLFERERENLEISQNELKQLSSIYSSYVDEEKLRFNFEQKLQEHRRIIFEINDCLQNKTKNVEQIQDLIDELKKIVQEKQRASNDCPTIIKVEPIDESTSTEPIKDELVSISFDRLKNLTIDTDYHRRKEIQNRQMEIDDEQNEHSQMNKPRRSLRGIRGLVCPFWMDGAYGINQQRHAIRLCMKKRYRDLPNHIRRYHGLQGPIVNLITKAVHHKIPVTTNYFSSATNVIDSQRNFLCPMIKDCQYRCYLPAGHLKAHLIDVHQLDPTTASLKINNTALLNRNKEQKIIRKVKTAIKQDKKTFK